MTGFVLQQLVTAVKISDQLNPGVKRPQPRSMKVNRWKEFMCLDL